MIGGSRRRARVPSRCRLRISWTDDCVISGSVATLTSDSRAAAPRVRRRCRGGAVPQPAERRADGLFERLRIDVADGDDRHPLRPVPGVVERAEPRRRRAADDVGLADRQPVGVARPVVEHGQLLLLDARAGAEAAAPFLDDHAALLVDLFRIEREAAGEVGQRGEPLG